MATGGRNTSRLVWWRVGALERLVVGLILRRGIIWNLIDNFRNSARMPFPAWLNGGPPHNSVF